MIEKTELPEICEEYSPPEGLITKVSYLEENERGIVAFDFSDHTRGEISLDNGKLNMQLTDTNEQTVMNGGLDSKLTAYHARGDINFIADVAIRMKTIGAHEIMGRYIHHLRYG